MEDLMNVSLNAKSGNATKAQMLKEAGITLEQYKKACVSVEEFIKLMGIKKTNLANFIVNCKKPSTIHAKIHKNHQDLYDSGFIEGWNFALDKIFNHYLGI